MNKILESLGTWLLAIGVVAVFYAAFIITGGY